MRRASLADEQARQMTAVELAAGAFSSRNVEIVGGSVDSVVAAEDTTEGVKITEVVVPGIQTHKLVHRRRFAPQVCFTYHSRISILFYALGKISCLFVGLG